MQIWRYSGVFLITTGIIHNAIGIILGWDFLLAIANDGIWDTMEVAVAPGSAHTRAELLWFLMLGFSWMMLGAIFHSEIKTKQLPMAKAWGWIILGQGLLMAVLFPQSGAWLFLPQGLIIIFAHVRPAEFSIK